MIKQLSLWMGSLLLCAQGFAAPSASVDITLFPAGDFKGTTTVVQGFATRKGDEFTAKDIQVDLRKLVTGIKLRDEHTQKHLDTKTYPFAKLIEAHGKGGKGEGLVEIRGKKHKVAGEYQVKGQELIATFPIQLSDYDIKDIKYMGVGVEDKAKISVTVPVK